MTAAENVIRLQRPADVHLTDVGNAERLIARHGADLRYVHPWGRWLVWDGARWQTDDSGHADARMKETLRALFADAIELGDDTDRKRLIRHVLDSERASRIRGALELARSEPGVPIQPDALDVDPLLLNVANVTLDLRAGKARPHDRADLITKLAPVVFDKSATAPLWDGFLERVQPNAEMRRFLARMVGYSLTGETGEQKLPIPWGGGANGKTTFIETISAMLGDYAQHAPAETFIERRDTIPNDVARLRGARFVAATEIAEGRRLNEALVKRMTGGDPLPARFMRGEWFEFQPTFKPWLVTNHKPEIRGVDEAIWRRVMLIPFTVTIPPDERDQHLPDKLRAELPGVLNWALAGYRDWRNNGLNEPGEVKAATSDYRLDSDQVGRFIDDCCVTSGHVKAKPSTLYQSYVYWANQNGEEPLKQKTFGMRLSDRGYTPHRGTGGARWWLGISIRHDEE